jgi:hypothetical protein
MVVDGAPQVLKLATGHRVGRPLRGIVATGVSVHVGKRLGSEERQKRSRPLRRFLWLGLGREDIPQIPRNHVRYRDSGGLAGATRRRFKPLAGDVLGE